jgi:hypothetical protein
MQPQPPTTPQPNSIESFHGRSRLLIVIDANDDDAALHTEWQSLTTSASALASRQITVIPVLRVDTSSPLTLPNVNVAMLNDDGMAEARQRYQCSDTDFCVVLVDLDGATLLRATSPVAADQIIHTLDDAEAQQHATSQFAVAQRETQLSTIIPAPSAAALAAPAHSLSDFVGHTRVLVVIDMHVDDPPFTAQWSMLSQSPAELRRRNITLVPIVRVTAPPTPASPGMPMGSLDASGAIGARNQFQCDNSDFCAVLIDRDGTPLLRSTQPISAPDIISRIDSTPTGKQEARQRARSPQPQPQQQSQSPQQ